MRIKEYFIKNLLLMILILGFSQINAQIVTNPNGAITPEDAIQNVLLGAGINAFNIEYNGSVPNAQNAQPNVTEFDATGTIFPIEDGIHMETNGAPAISDQDLADLANVPLSDITNGAIIEFDFVPDGTSLTFNYIFASAEYTSFTCSEFNDAFGFFISGPGINGPYSNNAINIATVPNSNNIPVTINSVNGGTATGGPASNCEAIDPNWQNNTQYFTTDYNNLYTNSFSGGYNGSTVVLPANATVECNDTFHIKLAISNVVDQSFDSGVFLEAGSFASDNVEISLTSDNAFQDTLIYRGCSEGVLDFNRFSCDLNDTLTIFVETGGSAIEGVDYEDLPDSVNFLPGEDNVSFNIVPTASGTNQAPESIEVTVFFIDDEGDTVTTTGTIWIVDAPDPIPIMSDTTLYCFQDSIPITGYLEDGFPPYSYEWVESGTTDSIDYVDIHENGEFYFILELSDQCNTITDTSVVVMDQTLQIDTMFQNPTECGLSTGLVNGSGSGFTGTPDYTWSGPGDTTTNSINATVWSNLPSGWYYFSIEDNACFVEDSIFLEEDPPPTADFEANPPAGNAPLEVTFVNNSDNADTYEWDFGNGDGNTVIDLSDQNTTYTEEGIYTVTLEITLGACSDVATEEIIVQLVLPLDFDMPNVFTPNGDGVNDVFTINPKNAVALDMVILNRWGNKVFESDDVDAVWDGRNQLNGEQCTEGTYFYQFTIVGEDGQVRREHGFVHLVRDN